MTVKKKSTEANKANAIIAVLIGSFVLILCVCLSIILIIRGLGSNQTVVGGRPEANLPYHTCPQELLQLDSEVVAMTEGYVQRMTTDDYKWVQSNCVFNTPVE